MQVKTDFRHEQAVQIRPITSRDGMERGAAEDFWTIDEVAVTRPSPGFYYVISVDEFFNARHYIAFDGRAGPAHSHSYHVQARCATSITSHDNQILIGFQELRSRLIKVLQAYNGFLLNQLPPFRKIQPTTENLVGVLFQQFEKTIADLPVTLIGLTIWESPTKAVSLQRDLTSLDR